MKSNLIGLDLVDFSSKTFYFNAVLLIEKKLFLFITRFIIYKKKSIGTKFLLTHVIKLWDVIQGNRDRIIEDKLIFPPTILPWIDVTCWVELGLGVEFWINFAIIVPSLPYDIEI